MTSVTICGEQLVAERGFTNKKRGIRGKFTCALNEGNRVIEDGDRALLTESKVQLDQAFEEAVHLMEEVMQSEVVSEANMGRYHED